jgi:Protein of unknown function (DUF3124)
MTRYHTQKWVRYAALLLLLVVLRSGTRADVHSLYGQTLYVPVYSEIPYGDRDRTIELTATLSIRNTDRKVTMTVQRVDYYNAQGQLVRAYVREPRALPALAAVEFVIKASDRSGGISASFIVVWESDTLCVPPVVEAVMLSTASTQGISFSSQARVVEEKR